MIGLPSALFAKLIAAIKVGSGDVIQFNSVLMPRLKALSMCDNFRGVCYRLGKCRRRDNAALDCLHREISGKYGNFTERRVPFEFSVEGFSFI